MKSGKFSDRDRFGKFTKLIPEFINLANSTPYIKSFWVNGSRAISSHHKHSDLDVTFIVSNEVSIKSLKKELKKLLDYTPDFVEYFLDTTSEYWEYKKTEVGVHIYTKEKFRKIVKSLFSGLINFEKYQSFAQHVVVESYGFVDKEYDLEKAKLAIKNFPMKLRSEVVGLYLKRLKQKTIWWEKRPVWKSVFEEITDLNLIINEIARCHYALNSRFYMYALKEYMKDLNELKPDLKEEMLVVARITPGNYFGVRKRKVIRSILQKLEAYFYEKNK